MALGNNKLFEIRIKGINRGTFARNCSPGITYVVASSMDKAYNTLRLLYGSDPDYIGNAKDFELDSIKLIADEANPNECETDTYKLIMADSFFERFVKDKVVDVNAISEFLKQEKEQQNKERLENDEDNENKDLEED